MYFYSADLTILFKQASAYNRTNESLSKNIALVMLNDPYLKTIHGQTGFKPYVFSLPYPYEKSTKTYEPNKPYRFTIRSIDETFIYALIKELSIHKGLDFHVIGSNIQRKKQFYIDTLYSITPVIISCKDAGSKCSYFWTMENNGDIMQLQRQLHNNLEKKYQKFYGEKLKSEQNFIQLLELKNRVPQYIMLDKQGKKIRFFGNKFKIIPNEDKVSQKLAFVALGCGLGEKNSYGGGFCLSKGMR